MADIDLSELKAAINALTDNIQDLADISRRSREFDLSGIENLTNKLKQSADAYEETANASENTSSALAEAEKSVKDVTDRMNEFESETKRLQDQLAGLVKNVEKFDINAILEKQAKGTPLRGRELEALKDVEAKKSIEGLLDKLAADGTELTSKLEEAKTAYNEALANNTKNAGTANETVEGIRSQLINLQKDTKAAFGESIRNLKQLANISLSELGIEKFAGGDALLRAKTEIILAGLGKVFSEAMKIFGEGIRKASALGVSAAEGVSIDLGNRFQSFISAFSFDSSKMVTPEQIASAQKAFVDASVGVREGRVISTEGSAEFAKTLKTGFKSEFELTSEALRGLSVAGLTSAEDFESFRQASGRASLSSGQFAQIVNKNSLSFLLFGNTVARAAADAERLGISFSSVQKGQESFVTNLDGGIDTIAQLNQLGAGIDFGTLVQLSEFGSPDQIMNYLKTAVPPDLMKGASVRALFGQLFPGLDAEALLRMNQVGSTLDTIEGSMTKGGTAETTGIGASLTQFGSIMKSTFGGLISAIVSLGIATAVLFKSSAANTAATLANTMALQQNTAAKLGLPVGSPIGGPVAGGVGSLFSLKSGLGVLGGIGLGTGIGTAMGADVKAAGTASLIGSIIGAVAGVGLAAFTGGVINPMTGAMIGGSLGGLIVGGANDADVTIPSGYGPYGLTDFSTNQTMAFNSGDRLLAMRKPEGSLSMGQTSEKVDKLAKSVDTLVGTLGKDVPIEINGQVQLVPSTKVLSGIRFRNDGVMA